MNVGSIVDDLFVWRYHLQVNNNTKMRDIDILFCLFGFKHLSTHRFTFQVYVRNTS